MRTRARLLLIGALALLGAGCAQVQTSNQPVANRIRQVRTTAYTCTERGGKRNAIGTRLSSAQVKSAAADWSRWPLGTKFRVVGTDEVFQVDDYGSALIGTGTIDLYKKNRLEMRQWGVRRVDIDVLEWGSPELSRRVLARRSGNRKVRAMLVALAKQSPAPALPPF
jgi:3D (Asp-Asp-Asp) domain-containing protein